MAPDYEYLLSRMKNYCSYQERCIQDVKDKLNQWKVRPEVTEKIINELIKNDFINEERFAKAFAGGKFRLKKWGNAKIVYELTKRNIPDIYIQISLAEIDEDEYIDTLKQIITKKDASLKEKNKVKRKYKLIRYAISKGYDPGMVNKIINQQY